MFHPFGKGFTQENSVVLLLSFEYILAIGGLRRIVLYCLVSFGSSCEPEQGDRTNVVVVLSPVETKISSGHHCSPLYLNRTGLACYNTHEHMLK